MSHRPVRKAVFPVAGLGTRFLPATKAVPKEMLTIVDRPVIQLVVDEARAAGIEHFIFVTGRNKGVIEDHFDRQVELEQTLQARGKTVELAVLADLLPGPGCTSFTRQQEPLGLGHAVWCARELVGNEPFAVLLPDVVVKTRGPGCLAQLIAAYDASGGNVIAVEEVAPEDVHHYGIVAIGEASGAPPPPGGPGVRAWPVTDMVEKPRPEAAPSNLMIMGRYILQPEIFTILEGQGCGAGGEIQLTDAMRQLVSRQPFTAVQYAGQSFDCGNKVGFLAANAAFALARDDIGPAFRRELDRLLGGRGAPSA